MDERLSVFDCLLKNKRRVLFQHDTIYGECLAVGIFIAWIFGHHMVCAPSLGKKHNVHSFPW